MISVVVPVYNVERWLGECVDSILSQSYGDIEVILVDDGSTDSSRQACDSYAAADGRVRVIHKSNGGLSDARNAGIDVAKGEYITCVDSDDVIASGMLQYLFNLLIENDADIACCQRLEIDESSKPLHDSRVHLDKKAVVLGREEALCNSLVDTVAWGKLYKSSLFEGIRYPVGRLHEDVFTTHKLVAAGKKVVVGNAKMYLYRIRSGSISKTVFTHRHMDMVYGKVEQAEYIRQHVPAVAKRAEAAIVYGACVCAQRMAKAGYEDKDDIAFVQKQIRRHEITFLRYLPCRLVTKLFSIVAFINLRLAMKIIKRK